MGAELRAPTRATRTRDDPAPEEWTSFKRPAEPRLRPDEQPPTVLGTASWSCERATQPEGSR